MKSEKPKMNMLEDDVYSVLKRLVLPMVFGVVGVVIFNLTDTFYISQLGTIQLAAISFTFPVVFTINSLNQGLAIGTSSIISRAVGAGERKRVAKLTTAVLLLAVVFAIVIMTLGFLFVDQLFLSLGADANTLPYIVEYMQIWFAGVPLVVIPMVGNNVIRALGDTKTPSMIMMIASGVNIVLDPFLIFGIGFFPAMGIAGAALTTVFSRLIVFSVSLYILVVREKVVSFENFSVKQMIKDQGEILYIGIPNAIARMIIPIGTGIITSSLAVVSVSAVAGFGIASKIEMLSLVIIQAIAVVVPVFVGQNMGAQKYERIQTALSCIYKFLFQYGIGIYILLFVSVPFVADVFTDDQAVIAFVVEYIRIVALVFAFNGVIQISNGFLNAIGKPFLASSVNLIQILIVYVGLKWITLSAESLTTIIGIIMLSYVISAGFGLGIMKKSLARYLTVKREAKPS